MTTLDEVSLNEVTRQMYAVECALFPMDVENAQKEFRALEDVLCKFIDALKAELKNTIELSSTKEMDLLHMILGEKTVIYVVWLKGDQRD